MSEVPVERWRAAKTEIYVTIGPEQAIQQQEGARPRGIISACCALPHCSSPFALSETGAVTAGKPLSLSLIVTSLSEDLKKFSVKKCVAGRIYRLLIWYS
jgi:hypothetical protein